MDLEQMAIAQAYLDHCREPACLPLNAIVVERFQRFPKPTNSGDIGEVEVTYDHLGHRAIYGVDPRGIATCYAD